jgi:hypothetical protein
MEKELKTPLHTERKITRTILKTDNVGLPLVH